MQSRAGLASRRAHRAALAALPGRGAGRRRGHAWWPRKPSRPSSRCAERRSAFGFWLGPTPDSILREQGIKLVDGRMPGFAACVGALPDDETAERLARDLQERNILVFMGGACGGETMAAQLNRRGVEMNWETFLVPYGSDTSSIVHALGFACRAAFTFGGLKPGGLKETREILLYNQRRVFAFVLALGEVDDEKFATAAGRHQLRLPGDRRHRYPGDPAQRHLHLRARGRERGPPRHACARGRGARGQDPHGGDPHPGAARPRVRRRAGAQGRRGRGVRRQVHAAASSTWPAAPWTRCRTG